MKIDWRTDTNAPVGRVIDLDTDEPISGPNGLCCFVNEETGEWKRYVFRDGKAQIGKDGKIVIECGRGRVKFIPAPEQPRVRGIDEPRNDP